MSLIRLERVSLAYGHKPLLDEVDFVIETGDKICLLGRNGEGKSSLMSLLTKAALPDSGEVIFDKSLKMGFLPQMMPAADERLAFDVVAEGLGDLGGWLQRYHALVNQGDQGFSDEMLAEMQVLQDKIESLNQELLLVQNYLQTY